MSVVKKVTGQWISSVIDTTGDTGSRNSVALDENGNSYVVYFELDNNSVRFASDVTGQWKSEEIVANVGSNRQSTSIVVDANGYVHFTYNTFSAGVRYVTNQTGAWFEENIAFPISYGASIVADDTGIFHMCFSTGGLSYASGEAGNWQIQGVDSENELDGCKIVIDSEYVPHITYYDVISGDLKFATKVDDVWNTEVLFSGKGGNALALDDSDSINIAVSSHAGVEHIAENGGMWVISELVDDGLPSGIGISSDGFINIIYKNSDAIWRMGFEVD